MRGRCAFTSTWDLTPDYSYFTWLFTLLNEKEKRNEATERAIFIDFQGPFHPANSSEYSDVPIPGHLEFPAWLVGHRQPGVEVTVGGVTCLKKSVYMSGLLVIGTSSICGGATTHNNQDGFAGNPRMMDPFSNSTFCKSLSYKHNAKSGVARDGGKSSIYGPFSSRYPN